MTHASVVATRVRRGAPSAANWATYRGLMSGHTLDTRTALDVRRCAPMCRPRCRSPRSARSGAPADHLTTDQKVWGSNPYRRTDGPRLTCRFAGVLVISGSRIRSTRHLLVILPRHLRVAWGCLGLARSVAEGQHHGEKQGMRQASLPGVAWLLIDPSRRGRDHADESPHHDQVRDASARHVSPTPSAGLLRQACNPAAAFRRIPMGSPKPTDKVVPSQVRLLPGAPRADEPPIIRTRP